MFAILGFLFLMIALYVWPTVRVPRLNASFEVIKENDTKETVLESMGNPRRIEGCGEYLGDNPTGCVREFVYAHPYAPLAPEYWVVYFNSNNRVLGKVHLVSP